MQACNRRIFLRVSKFHARYQEFEKRPLPRNIVQQILQIRIPPISQFLYKINQTASRSVNEYNEYESNFV